MAFVFCSCSFGGDAITMKINVGCRRPYLLTDRNHFQAESTREIPQDNFKIIRLVVSREM